ncbi:MAG: hypothetical protein ABJL67_02020 [Sulfitobacter sp.]
MQKKADDIKTRAIVLRDTADENDMRDDDRPAAPNFTQACVVMFGVNITWIFMLIWSIWGLLAVAALGWVVNKVITRIDLARN